MRDRYVVLQCPFFELEGMPLLVLWSGPSVENSAAIRFAQYPCEQESFQQTAHHYRCCQRRFGSDAGVALCPSALKNATHLRILNYRREIWRFFVLKCCGLRCGAQPYDIPRAQFHERIANAFECRNVLGSSGALMTG